MQLIHRAGLATLAIRHFSIHSFLLFGKQTHTKKIHKNKEDNIKKMHGIATQSKIIFSTSQGSYNQIFIIHSLIRETNMRTLKNSHKNKQDKQTKAKIN